MLTAYATINVKSEGLDRCINLALESFYRYPGPRGFLLFFIIIKFPYNAHSDWLKQRTLSEYKGQVNDSKLAFKFLLRNFDKFDLN